MINSPSSPNLAWALFQAMFPSVFDGDRVRMGLTADQILGPLEKNGIGPSYAYSLTKLVREYPENFVSPEEVGRIRDALTSLGLSSTEWQSTERKRLLRDVGHFKALSPLSEVTLRSDVAGWPPPELREIDTLLRMESSKRAPYERKQLMTLHVQWTTQGGGRVQDPKMFRSSDFISNLVHRRIPSETIIDGTQHMLFSKLWGGEIDMRRLNAIVGEEYYLGPLGMARLARDRSIAVGRFLTDKPIWGPKEELEINQAMGWSDTAITQIHWRTRLYLTALAQHEDFVNHFKGEAGFIRFSACYFPKNMAHAKRFAMSMLTRERRHLLKWWA